MKSLFFIVLIIMLWNYKLSCPAGDIPFVITSGLRFFEQAHVKDLVAQLRFVVNPKMSLLFTDLHAFFLKSEKKLMSKLLSLSERVSNEKKINIFKAFTEIDVINKIPKDAKEDWVGLAETLAKRSSTRGQFSNSIKSSG